MVQVVRKSEADALAATQAGSGMGSANIERILEREIELERLRALQTLRTGKPAGPAVAAAPKEAGHLEAVKITQQVEELEAFHNAVLKVADRIQPKPNPYEFLNSGFMSSMGEGLGQLAAELGREAMRVRRERGQLRGPVVGGTAPNIPAQPPPRLAPEKPPPPPPPEVSGFVGSAKEDVFTQKRPPPSPTPGNPGNPGPAVVPAPVTLRLSDEDKDMFAKTQRMIQTLADMNAETKADVRAFGERLAKLESGRESGDKVQTTGRSASEFSPQRGLSDAAAQSAPEPEMSVNAPSFEMVKVGVASMPGKPVVVKPTPPPSKLPKGVTVTKITKLKPKEAKHGKGHSRR